MLLTILYANQFLTGYTFPRLCFQRLCLQRIWYHSFCKINRTITFKSHFFHLFHWLRRISSCSDQSNLFRLTIKCIICHSTRELLFFQVRICKCGERGRKLMLHFLHLFMKVVLNNYYLFFFRHLSNRISSWDVWRFSMLAIVNKLGSE